jgi:hypothetical protein
VFAPAGAVAPAAVYTAPMPHRLRTALMWLLLLALPLQGFAAATMLTCGPNHHRLPVHAAAASVHDHGHDHGNGNGQHHAHAHEHAPAPAQADAEAAVDVAADRAPSSHAMDQGAKSKSKCSACAACCIGAALPAAALVFAPFDAATAPVGSAPASRVGFFTDGPDRPPRLHLV